MLKLHWQTQVNRNAESLNKMRLWYRPKEHAGQGEVSGNGNGKHLQQLELRFMLAGWTDQGGLSPDTWDGGQSAMQTASLRASPDFCRTWGCARQ